MVEHIPVMLKEVIESLKNVESPQMIVDATLGLGGYAEEILNVFPATLLVGIDRDEQAISLAQKRLVSFAERVHIYNSPFSAIAMVLSKENAEPDGIVFDLGVSNLQLSSPERGFSFQNDGPLDMRMEGTSGESGYSAAQIVNTFSEKELADIFWKYGEERY
jgi:16S rRNA (cytosine1402-N4)-methyltransferase